MSKETIMMTQRENIDDSMGSKQNTQNSAVYKNNFRARNKELDESKSEYKKLRQA